MYPAREKKRFLHLYRHARTSPKSPRVKEEETSRSYCIYFTFLYKKTRNLIEGNNPLGKFLNF